MIARIGLFLAAILVMGLGSNTYGAASSPADLAIQSRLILQKHCGTCHGDKPTLSTLSILDHSQLLKTSRPVPLITPKGLSQAIELIEEGSMPPGRLAKVSADELAVLQAWVNSGATTFPIRFDDEFAYRSILADVEKIEKANPDDIHSIRYLSLHHLAADGSTADLVKERTEFLQGVLSVVKAAMPSPVAIDPTQTIFRIDLREAGWHHKPFKKIKDDRTDGGPADGNLFDVILLEYPHGVLPQNSAVFDAVSTKFLKPAGQVRPIAFVRGDWFVGVTTSLPLANELRNLIKPYEPVPPGLSRPKAAPPAFVASKTAGLPVPAIDALYGVDPEQTTIKELRVGTYDFSLNKARSVFSPNDKFRLRIATQDRSFFEMIWLNSDRVIETFSEVKETAAGKTTEINLPDNDVLGDVLGDERIMVFLASRDFPRAERWRPIQSEKPVERLVHPLYRLEHKGDQWVPSLRDPVPVRATANIKIVASDKKK